MDFTQGLEHCSCVSAARVDPAATRTDAATCGEHVHFHEHCQFACNLKIHANTSDRILYGFVKQLGTSQMQQFLIVSSS